METFDPFPLNFIELAVTIRPIDLIIVQFVLLDLLLIIISAFISGAESAYFSLNSNEVESLQKKDDYSSKKVIRLLQKPQILLSTLFIANIVSNIAFIILGSYTLNLIFNFDISSTTSFLIQAAIIAFFILFFGEILPKYYGSKKPKRTARFLAYPMWFLYRVFYPFSLFLVSSTKFIAKRFATIKQNITMDDLSNALNLTTNQIAEDENILKGIVKFGNIDAKEIMKSRIDVNAVDISTPFSELQGVIIESGHSRIPVYEENFDNIKGILYIKDLLPHLNEEGNFKWQDLLRAPYFVPENKKINDLLKEFQSNKIHMAIVIDEYGGTSGIVTLEDILEEIVGEITDESDEDEVIYSQINNNTYLFEGKTLLNDFFKIVNLDPDYLDAIKGDADTIAGLILEITGEIPHQGQIISHKNLKFHVESADRRRIKRVKVEIN